VICFTICKSYKTWYIFAIWIFQFCTQVTHQQIFQVNTVTGLLFCNDCVNWSKNAVDEEQWGVLLYLYRKNFEPCPWTLQLSQALLIRKRFEMSKNSSWTFQPLEMRILHCLRTSSDTASYPRRLEFCYMYFFQAEWQYPVLLCHSAFNVLYSPKCFCRL
jgi:hypothetical protein